MATTKKKTSNTEVPFAIQRDCTRCEGVQAVLDWGFDMGLYVCDTCYMRVGFDLKAPNGQKEFMLFRGEPRFYTKNVFGNRLLPLEVRIASN